MLGARFHVEGAMGQARPPTWKVLGTRFHVEGAKRRGAKDQAKSGDLQRPPERLGVNSWDLILSNEMFLF